jgi:HSP20 family molecular chaperone IbpA
MSQDIPEEDFRQLSDYIRQMVSRAQDEYENKPIAFGIYMMIRDGHCHVLPPTWSPMKALTGSEGTGADEPAVEVHQVGGETVVTAALPGVTADSVRVWQEDAALHIAAEDGEQRYYTTVALPSPALAVERMSFKHGVLEVVVGPSGMAEIGDILE